MTVTESSNALSVKLDAIVSQIAAAAVAEKNARDASAEAYISGDASQIATADSALRAAQSKLTGLSAARESIMQKIAAAKVQETNAHLATLRATLADLKEPVTEGTEDVEDCTVTLVEAVERLQAAGVALNQTGRQLAGAGGDNLWGRDVVAMYISNKMAKLFPGFSGFRDYPIESLYDSTIQSLNRVK